jgi:hypothetical protein
MGAMQGAMHGARPVQGPRSREHSGAVRAWAHPSVCHASLGTLHMQGCVWVTLGDTGGTAAHASAPPWRARSHTDQARNGQGDRAAKGLCVLRVPRQGQCGGRGQQAQWVPGLHHTPYDPYDMRHTTYDIRHTIISRVIPHRMSPVRAPYDPYDIRPTVPPPNGVWCNAVMRGSGGWKQARETLSFNHDTQGVAEHSISTRRWVRPQRPLAARRLRG